MNDYVSKPVASEMLAAALARGIEVKTTLLGNQMRGARAGDVQPESESALCKETLRSLKELAPDMGESFYPRLLEAFARQAVGHLAALRSAFAVGETGRLRGEAHALKEASLAVGAQGMADICQQLENFEATQNVGGAPEELARLDRELIG